MESQISLPVFLSPVEAAVHVGVSRRTIDRAIADGQLPAYRAGSRVVRIRVTDLEGWLRPIEAA
ncbi:excisionase family DNA-binding protein [Isoptericola cucumis]|uniref:Helix-turn-helix domain-containing protein n=1 Tax=Isoptericola cucumis TaxID=1776856 RepID=A0ABQ2B774_9MICO|nr:excisionase family DNA-binding protein [Isoptericola cucumis]GGI06986.1 hypothetical protein GCM10007368_13900 [Isoptericola cucumis]